MGQTKRPMPRRCRDDPGGYVTRESVEQFLNAYRQEGLKAI